ncbi:MAG: gamma-glutamylcyclotransferase family protein [Halolamina sp.]
MDIFVYGSLTEPEQVGQVVDSFAFLGPAVLTGLHPVQGESPTLAPGGKTGGRLLRTAEVAALDSDERVDDDLYVRVSVPLIRDEGEGEGTVEVYVGDPTRLGVEEPAVWPGSAEVEPFSDRVERYLREQDVQVQYRD